MEGGGGQGRIGKMAGTMMVLPKKDLDNMRRFQFVLPNSTHVMAGDARKEVSLWVCACVCVLCMDYRFCSSESWI